VAPYQGRLKALAGWGHYERTDCARWGISRIAVPFGGVQNVA
jgi:hypothetical protein